MRRPWRIAAILLFAVTVLGGGLLGDRLLALSDSARQSLRQYTEMVTVAQQSYGDDVSYKDLVFASIGGMLRTLDPHTNFLAPDNYRRMRERQQSSFYGLGILVGMRDGQLTVVSPLEGTPASRMGIRAGDIISVIDGEPTDGMALDDAVQRLKGPKGTQVTISIVRRGVRQPLEMTITRDEIPLNTVVYVSEIVPGTGYFRITDFSRSTGKEVADAIAELKGKGVQRLLVDLRNNGGGLLDQAIEVADQFVPKDTLIVETRGRTRDSFQQYEAEGKHQPLDLPVVVLVNSGSASAAEILAGAIQDHDVGVIVGTPTWGKGLVQTVYSLSYGAALALTTARYYTPSGRLIQRDYTSVYDYYAHTDRDAEADPRQAQQGQVFHTDLGRDVYGGGGITPDVLVEPQELPELVQFLTARNAFFNFGVELANRQEIAPGWKPDEQVLEEFRHWLAHEELGTEVDFDEAIAEPGTRAEVLEMIQAEVYRSEFGSDAWYRVLAEGDNQIQEALQHFDEASHLLAQRRQLEEGGAKVAAKDGGRRLAEAPRDRGE